MIKIKRIAINEYGTFGNLLVNDIPIMVTLECLPLGNQKNISCIPAGFYQCEKITSETKGKCISIKNVLDRTGILIHSGNTLQDTEGCILVGFSYGELEGIPSILNSRNALKKLLNIVSSEFVLHIVDCY